MDYSTRDRYFSNYLSKKNNSHNYGIREELKKPYNFDYSHDNLYSRFQESSNYPNLLRSPPIGQTYSSKKRMGGGYQYSIDGIDARRDNYDFLREERLGRERPNRAFVCM
jgi:hypothetical protein